MSDENDESKCNDVNECSEDRSDRNSPNDFGYHELGNSCAGSAGLKKAFEETKQSKGKKWVKTESRKRHLEKTDMQIEQVLSSLNSSLSNEAHS